MDTSEIAGETKVKPDRRKNLRAPMIVLRAKVEGDRKTFFGYAKNISRSGMFIGSINPQEPGSQFRVEFSLPDPLNLTIQCGCEVVWKRLWTDTTKHEPGMGLRFLDIPADTAEAIDAWISATGDQLSD
jgi:uncharacterized protein (TIGR02266 family)